MFIPKGTILTIKTNLLISQGTPLSSKGGLLITKGGPLIIEGHLPPSRLPCRPRARRRRTPGPCRSA